MNPKEYSDLYEEWELEQTMNTAMQAISSAASITAGSITAAQITPNTHTSVGGYYNPGFAPNTGQPIMSVTDPRVLALEAQMIQLRSLIEGLTDASEDSRKLLEGFVQQVQYLTQVVQGLQADLAARSGEPMEQLSTDQIMKQIQGPDA